MSADSSAALHGLRIGCVKYLNSRPLIRTCREPVLFAHPAELADRLRAGELDAGLIPVFEAMRIPDLVAADDVGIAAQGEVYSVVLAYRGELSAITQVALDPASRTSAHLVQIVLAEFHQLHPHYGSESDHARLLIGTQAIDFRAAHGDTWRYLDLGLAWKEHTGLPFVFALWMLRADLPELAAVAESFRTLKHQGLAALEEICASESDPVFARRYLTQHIHFPIGPAEKAGLTRFRELLQKHSLLPPDAPSIRFV